MTIPPYLEVISVIDHHKTSLNTYTPPLAIIADAQSSNSLVARAAFEINDRVKRLLALQKNAHLFLHPEREYLEYLHFLYGIIDDTDLLSKVSALDLECIVSLLNRLKSLSLGKPTILLSLDDLPRDASYLKKGARRILQDEDMYSLYRKVYAFREKEVENNISLTATQHPSNFFADTKEQNGCCSVGQTKVFARNIPHLHKHLASIRHIWLDKARKIHHHKKEIDLHIHMISTIVSAEEVYRGAEENYSHKDELWLWIPAGESAAAHLKRFLSAFQSLPALKNNPLELELLGDNALAQIFKESFLDIPHKIHKQGLPIAVLKFRAGSLNSRKAMVSPFLPSL